MVRFCADIVYISQIWLHWDTMIIILHMLQTYYIKMKFVYNSGSQIVGRAP